MPIIVRKLAPKIGADFELGRLTILVGPNNCGKSQTLRDIRTYLTTGQSEKLLAIKGVEAQFPNYAENLKHINRRPHPSPGHETVRGVGPDLQSHHEFAPPTEWLTKNIVPEENQQVEFLRHFGNYWVAHLDAERRFQLAAPTDSYDTREASPSNALQAFFGQGRIAWEELRKAFKSAFGVDITLDWAAMRRFALVIANDFGEIPDIREGLDKLVRSAQPLANQGDGYRSFAGVALSTLTFPDRVLLLDEPEAFLHPAQARALGRWIAGAAENRSGQIIIASHSADFLFGLVSGAQDVTVVRLNRIAHETRYHVVPPATTANLIKSPLLSSQPVMDALFHKGVVVCEGDADRSVYQTIAHSSSLLGKDVGEDILFIHSNGKDAAESPIKLLREAGTPVCAALDLDLLNSQTLFFNIIKALTASDPNQSLLQLRETVANSVEATNEAARIQSIRDKVSAWLAQNHTDLRQVRRSLKSIADEGSSWSRVKKLGINFFQGNDHGNINVLISKLNEIGLFLAPCGELESWMQLSSATKGPSWNRAALESLCSGSCPENLKDYVRSIVLRFRQDESPDDVSGMEGCL